MTSGLQIEKGAGLPATLRAKQFTVLNSVMSHPCLTVLAKLPSAQFFCKDCQAKEMAAGGDSGRLLTFPRINHLKLIFESTLQLYSPPQRFQIVTLVHFRDGECLSRFHQIAGLRIT